MHVRLFRPKGPEHIAFVAVVPASSGPGVLVQVSKGASRLALIDSKAFGPLSPKEAHEVFQRELDVLRGEGFRKSGLGELLARLESKKRRVRALAARRLGWLREPGSVDALLALAGKAKDELPVVLDALGELGDPVALPVLRAAADKKLLSRRRSAVEALRKLGDATGLADAKNRALERLPQALRDHVGAASATETESPTAADVVALVAVVRAAPKKDRGLALDTLYELATPLGVAAARALVIEDGIDAPHMWRYVKSVLKRAMLRYDFLTFATIVYRVELTARVSKGTVATVKSGFDGELKEMRIFAPETTRYVRRAAWRYLRSIAQHRPSWYAYAAAEAIAPYAPADQEKPRGLFGGFAGAYLLNRVLWEAGGRLELDGRTLRFKYRATSKVHPPPAVGEERVREEAHPGLWDLEPDAYARVLAAARLPLAHDFALAALSRHPDVIGRAPSASIVGMLSAPHPRTVELALAELERRVDPAAPDLDLLRLLLADARPDVRDVGLRVLAQSVAAWSRDAATILSLLGAADAGVRAAIATQVTGVLATLSEATRRDLVTGLLAFLGTTEKEEGAHDAHAEIARALADDVARLATMPALLALLAAASPAAQSVGAMAIASRADALAELGRDRVVAMAVHPHALVREAARKILDRMAFELASDASPLYPLVDCDWPDARAFALQVFRTRLNPATFALDVIIGLCDSPHADVQAFGRELVETRLDALPGDELIEKLVQHPMRPMRRFALGLVVKKLRPGFVRLAPLEEFFRTILLDVSPDRAMKREAIAFLERRGRQDELQAEVVVRLLSELSRSKTQDDIQRTVVALARIRIAFPAVKGALALDLPPPLPPTPGGASP